MALRLLGDSNVSRVWHSVRGDREALRTGTLHSVKERGGLMDGLKAITSTVSCLFVLCGDLNANSEIFV